jgi:sugar phosphate isomerase/epimerase
MNLALSNLAWDYDNESVFEKLKSYNIDLIEFVFTKLFDWETLNDDLVYDFLKKINSHNLKVKSVQSLFHNVNCNTICNYSVVIPHFEKLIHYCKILSCEILVLGSPNLRNFNNSSKNDLIKTFLTLDNMLNDTNIQISIEPNSKIYGGDFFFNNLEIINFIKETGLKNITTMIDTHNLINESLSPEKELINNFKFINHIHISENNLGLLNDIKFHESFSNSLKKIGYKKIITYEVKKQINVWDSVKLFTEIYK